MGQGVVSQRERSLVGGWGEGPGSLGGTDGTWKWAPCEALSAGHAWHCLVDPHVGAFMVLLKELAQTWGEDSCGGEAFTQRGSGDSHILRVRVTSFSKPWGLRPDTDFCPVARTGGRVWMTER